MKYLSAGNKRTAAATVARFLFLNGYELNATNKALEKFVLKVATAKIDLELIASWIRNHSYERNWRSREPGV
jgi:prophage maintenance system killer protein